MLSRNQSLDAIPGLDTRQCGVRTPRISKEKSYCVVKRTRVVTLLMIPLKWDTAKLRDVDSLQDHSSAEGQHSWAYIGRPCKNGRRCKYSLDTNIRGSRILHGSPRPMGSKRSDIAKAMHVARAEAAKSVGTLKHKAACMIKQIHCT